MAHVRKPADYEPPTSAELLRYTAIAALAAAVLLIVVVLPAEYGIDPTGLGARIGLKQMGEIKTQLAGEAAADAASSVHGAGVATGTSGSASPAPLPTVPVGDEPSAPPAVSAAEGTWRDELTHQLAPDEGVEFKLVMDAGSVAEFSWTTDGGGLNYNMHGDGAGRSVEYEKGRALPGKDGSITAAFDGHHGWFWRNRSGKPVTLTLRTRGEYSALKRTS
ncbi:MAG: transmembrane anchor protein [bacterium]